MHSLMIPRLAELTKSIDVVMLNTAGLFGGPARVEWEEAQGAIVTAERAIIRAMRALKAPTKTRPRT